MLNNYSALYIHHEKEAESNINNVTTNEREKENERQEVYEATRENRAADRNFSCHVFSLS